MADPFTGEIRIFPWGWQPVDWQYCDGTELQVVQYQALYSIIGNTYGGMPPSTFKVPDLRGFAPAGVGPGPGLTPVVLGKSFGVSQVALTESQIQSHNHSAIGYSAQPSNLIEQANANTAYVARAAGQFSFSTQTTPTAEMQPASILAAGGGGGHDNMQPYLAMAFYICTNGEYPSPS
jgi:microcystin-dependent protein